VLAFAALQSLGNLAAQEIQSAPRTEEYAAFRIITDRNIFNANRSGRPPRANREARRPSRVEAFALLGTMSYEKGRFAFFDGSSSDYRQTLKPEGTIAEFKVLEIGGNSVKLDRKGKQIDLRVGSQLRREDGGEWQVAEGKDLPSGSTGSPAASASASTSAPSGGPETASPSSTDGGGGGGGGEMSEVLKRLLEQRERETK